MLILSKDKKKDNYIYTNSVILQNTKIKINYINT